MASPARIKRESFYDLPTPPYRVSLNYTHCCFTVFCGLWLKHSQTDLRTYRNKHAQVFVLVVNPHLLVVYVCCPVLVCLVCLQIDSFAQQLISGWCDYRALELHVKYSEFVLLIIFSNHVTTFFHHLPPSAARSAQQIHKQISSEIIIAETLTGDSRRTENTFYILSSAVKESRFLI